MFFNTSKVVIIYSKFSLDFDIENKKVDGLLINY